MIFVTRFGLGNIQDPIHEAKSQADFQQVKRLLEAGENPNRLDPSGQTPLHRAADPVIVKLLIDAGANVNATDKCSWTPLHLVKNIECARLLLNAGADPDARSREDLSPLGHAGSVETAKLLIEAGADVQLRRRSSLLHHRPTPELAKLFIGAGVGVNCLDQNGRTPLDVAEESRQIFQRQAEQLGFHVHAAQAKQYAELVTVLRTCGGKHGQQRKPNNDPPLKSN
ncbi:MAG TPA: ankyrin repeat domain-containing protein [Humisphaera sp.]|nr:ankyrin repeat domain-containing protein [Humisphaera sp.]